MGLTQGVFWTAQDLQWAILVKKIFVNQSVETERYWVLKNAIQVSSLDAALTALKVCRTITV